LLAVGFAARRLARYLMPERNPAMNTRTVRILMTHNVVTARPGTAFKEIVDMMATERVSALPVVDAAARVVGIVSEADLLHKLDPPTDAEHAWLISRRQRAAAAKAAGDVAADLMTKPAVTIGPDATAAAAARLMQRHQIKRLPVVDTNGRLVGIVSRRDLLGAYLRTDDDIRADVRENVLMRDLLIGPTDVSATVHDGVVTLTGTVDSRSLARITGRLVRAVTGVIDVANHLRWEYDDSADIKRRYVFDAEIMPPVRRPA
jgi:CBS domain-containing protein